MQENRATTGRLRRVIRRAVLGLTILVVLLAGAGALYNAMAIRRLRQTYPPPGRLYTVDGYRMHLYCSGTGSPTVILESGLAESFLVWGKVQPALSRVTRVCSYDRAGLGWSEAVPGARDPDHMAGQLHALLAAAGISGPLVLMGHSAGGLHIRAYTARFPQDVGGLVFVDATTPGQDRRIPAAVRALGEHGPFQRALFKTMIALGIPRALGECTTPPPGFGATANLWRADACRPSYVTTWARESAALRPSPVEPARNNPFGELPVLVFSRDPHSPPPHQLPASVSAADWQQSQRIHDAMQENIKQLSTHNRRIIAKGSGHYIHFERPELLVREVTTFIQAIRAGGTLPGEGTTVTE